MVDGCARCSRFRSVTRRRGTAARRSGRSQRAVTCDSFRERRPVPSGALSRHLPPVTTQRRPLWFGVTVNDHARPAAETSTLVRVSMRIGRLDAVPALDRPDLMAPAVAAALTALDGKLPADAVGVAEIDPELADTGAFCDRYGVALTESANCVVVAGRRDGETRFAACVVLAPTRADANGAGPRQLDVRKASFAAVDTATEQTAMEYGGITPIGVPPGLPVVPGPAGPARLP